MIVLIVILASVLSRAINGSAGFYATIGASFVLVLLHRIFAWIARDNPRAALNMIARIEDKVMRLESPELTYMGRPGLVEGTRELLEWPYIIVYKVYEDREEVVIVSIAHGAQDREGRKTKSRAMVPRIQIYYQRS